MELVLSGGIGFLVYVQPFVIYVQPLEVLRRIFFLVGGERNKKWKVAFP
jgi:hypothetical protein